MGVWRKNQNTNVVERHRHTSRDVGDEPLLLAQTAPTWIGAEHRRCPGRHQSGIDVIVMDDGPYPTLHKDLSILVVDGYGFEAVDACRPIEGRRV